MQFRSARAENAAAIADRCPFVFVSQMLGTHWRPTILWEIAHGTLTYNALRRAVPDISDKMLASDLLELSRRGLVNRHVFSSKPRRSAYEVTPRGLALVNVLRDMNAWADAHFPDRFAGQLR